MIEHVLSLSHYRLRRTGIRLLILGLAMICAGVFFFSSWDAFHPQIANDGDTPLFAHWARNLIRYPLAETKAQFADLIGMPPSSLIAGEPMAVYVDHPPGLIWVVAIAQLIGGESIIAGRAAIAALATAALLMTLAFVYRRVGLAAALASTAVSLTLPHFWEHSVVVHLTGPTIFFTVAAAISFIAYLRTATPSRLCLALLLWIGGMLSDWPAYLLGGPIAILLTYRRQWKDLLLFSAVGVATMAAVFALVTIGEPRFSVTTFFSSSLKPLVDSSAPHLQPIPLALKNIAINMVRGFSVWTLFLVLPFVIWPWQHKLTTERKELWFLFLSFLFVGGMNDIVFIQWAATHSHWSYYLIPSILVGAALTAQTVVDVARRADRSISQLLIVASLVLFLSASLTAAISTARLKLPQFRPPESISHMLEARRLGDMLGQRSVLLVGQHCRTSRPTAAVEAAGLQDVAQCEIYWHQGFKARFYLDRPGIPASDFDPGKMGCERTFIVLKGPHVTARLAELSLVPSHVEWFDWYVLRLSELPSRYCEQPARLFDDLIAKR